MMRTKRPNLNRVNRHLGSAPLTGEVTATQVGTVRVEGLRRDFKFSGTIGDGTGDLSYLSLVRQIETGKKKGHSDVELVDAVIRAVKPSCRLRAYVESCDNITLNTLLKVVRHSIRREPQQNSIRICANSDSNPRNLHRTFCLGLWL